MINPPSRKKEEVVRGRPLHHRRGMHAAMRADLADYDPGIATHLPRTVSPCCLWKDIADT